jgi:predicted Holliday junction resolvase-like endonuclease
MTDAEFQAQQAELDRQLKLAQTQQQIKQAQEWTWEREATVQSGIDPVLAGSYQSATKSLIDVLQGQTSQQPAVYVQGATASAPNYLLWIGAGIAVYFLLMKR